jgi:hypothetical protein
MQEASGRDGAKVRARSRLSSSPRARAEGWPTRREGRPPEIDRLLVPVESSHRDFGAFARAELDLGARPLTLTWCSGDDRLMSNHKLARDLTPFSSRLPWSFRAFSTSGHSTWLTAAAHPPGFTPGYCGAKRWVHELCGKASILPLRGGRPGVQALAKDLAADPYWDGYAASARAACADSSASDVAQKWSRGALRVEGLRAPPQLPLGATGARSLRALIPERCAAGRARDRRRGVLPPERVLGGSALRWTR